MISKCDLAVAGINSRIPVQNMQAIASAKKCHPRQRRGILRHL